MSWFRKKPPEVKSCDDDAICAYEDVNGGIHRTKKDRDDSNKRHNYNKALNYLTTMLMADRHALVEVDGVLKTYQEFSASTNYCITRKDAILLDIHQQRQSANDIARRLLDSADEVIDLINKAKGMV